MIRAYALASTAQSAVRILAILSLWASGGRSSETGCLTWEQLTWDKEFKSIFAQIFQSKSAKLKLIAFVAGVASPLV